MIIYNVTIKVSHSIAKEWLQWLKEEHIPELLNTGCFSNATILHLIDSDDEEGITYAVQYHAPTREHYNRYIEDHSTTMRQKGHDKWGDKFIAFRTLMQVVN
jgi:hypothetical protein